MREVICQYCQGLAVRMTGEELYKTQNLDYMDSFFWVCVPCEAWVGCHDISDRPLGILANKALRQAKHEAHRDFDPLWKKGKMTRSDAYAWLAGQLDIPIKRCHIGEFSLEQCREVVRICQRRRYGLVSKRPTKRRDLPL